jgi:hypothetical protein
MTQSITDFEDEQARKREDLRRRGILADGERVTFSALFMDSAARHGAAPVSLTDSERTFASTPDGQRAIATAKRQHHARHAYLGDQAPAWNATDEEQVVRGASAMKARSDQARAVSDAAAGTALVTADAARVTDLAMRKQAIRDSWRKPAGC